MTPTPAGKTYTTYVVPAGTHDVVYENCLFTGGLPTSNGVLTLNQPCYNITFRNCTIDSGPVNGVTIVDAGNTIHDVTFEGCTFKSSARMGFECISRGSSTAIYQRINLVNCTFEPQGDEAVSYDGPALPANCTISGVTIKGAGNNPAATYGHAFEINGPTYFTISNMTVYRTRASMLNLTGKTSDSHWSFTDCSFDATTKLQTVDMESGARIVAANGMNGAVFTRCILNAASSAYNVGYLDNCSNNDFRTSQLLGAGSKAGISQVGSSAGNLLP